MASCDLAITWPLGGHKIQVSWEEDVPCLEHAVEPVAAWIPQRGSVAAMARFHASDKFLGGYDGVYVDDFFPEFYHAWATYAHNELQRWREPRLRGRRLRHPREEGG